MREAAESPNSRRTDGYAGAAGSTPCAPRESDERVVVAREAERVSDERTRCRA